jgi:hypothetical protein
MQALFITDDLGRKDLELGGYGTSQEHQAISEFALVNATLGVLKC